MAFLNDGAELAFAWCDENCESQDGGAWGGRVVETQTELSAERPTAIPFTCDAELWNGLAPQLALTAEGRPVVAYDVSVQSRCLYHDGEHRSTRSPTSSMRRGAGRGWSLSYRESHRPRACVTLPSEYGLPRKLCSRGVTVTPD
jgi:hypothetical protein